MASQMMKSEASLACCLGWKPMACCCAQFLEPSECEGIGLAEACPSLITFNCMRYCRVCYELLASEPRLVSSRISWQLEKERKERKKNPTTNHTKSQHHSASRAHTWRVGRGTHAVEAQSS